MRHHADPRNVRLRHDRADERPPGLHIRAVRPQDRRAGRHARHEPVQDLRGAPADARQRRHHRGRQAGHDPRPWHRRFERRRDVRLLREGRGERRQADDRSAPLLPGPDGRHRHRVQEGDADEPQDRPRRGGAAQRHRGSREQRGRHSPGRGQGAHQPDPHHPPQAHRHLAARLRYQRRREREPDRRR